MALLVVLALTPSAEAALIRNISTGLNSSGTALLPPFTVDPNYTVTGPGNQTFFAQARVAGPSLPPSYINDAALPGSRWDYLVSTPDETTPEFTPAGEYVFRITVDVTGFDPASVFIENLLVAADNFFLGVRLNGVDLLSRTPPPGIPEEFGFVVGPPTIPPILGLGSFLPGVNTIELRMLNLGFGGAPGVPSPGAFRAQGTVQGTPIGSAVPEPASVMLAAIGGAALLGYRLRRRARPPR
jgi:hypothetical protein